MQGRRMRTWAAIVAAAGATAAIAVAATSVLGSDEGSPVYGKVSIDLSDSKAKPPPNNTTKPQVVYLKSGETSVDPIAIGTPYLDIKLTGCRKVIDGGILPERAHFVDDGNAELAARPQRGQRIQHRRVRVQDFGPELRGHLDDSPRPRFPQHAIEHDGVVVAVRLVIQVEAPARRGLLREWLLWIKRGETLESRELAGLVQIDPGKRRPEPAAGKGLGDLLA